MKPVILNTFIFFVSLLFSSCLSRKNYCVVARAQEQATPENRTVLQPAGIKEHLAFLNSIIKPNMPDTIIKGIHYRVMKNEWRMDTERGPLEYMTIGYLRCNMDTAKLFRQRIHKKTSALLARFEYYCAPDFSGRTEYVLKKKR